MLIIIGTVKFESYLDEDVARAQRQEFFERYGEITDNTVGEIVAAQQMHRASSPRTNLARMLRKRGVAPEPLGFNRFNKAVLQLR